MALLNDEIKGSEFFNKRTGYLMVLWLKERFKALNSYAISNEKKLEHLKLFHEFDKQYSYRVIAYAIHEYGKNGGFKEYGGTLKDFSLQKELVSAFNKCIQMCESGYPKVYDPDIKEFKRIPQNWDGHIYVEKIKEYGLKTGDVVHESKKGEFDE